MIKRIILAGLVFSLFCEQSALAENRAFIPGSGSHFRFLTSGHSLNVTTTTPNRTYPNAGIQVLTPGYTVSGNIRRTNDGFYLFSVSDTVPATINLIGQGGDVKVKICLNGVGKKYSCEKQTITGIANSHIIFLSSTQHNGNFGGATGADAFCQSAAYQPGSMIPAGLTFKALLITSTRFPCSSKNGGVSGNCGGSFARDWPLIAGTEYIRPDATTFNTVNSQGVFDGSNPTIYTEQGDYLFNQFFWMGIQSIFSNSFGTDIDGWAYTDMNSAADNVVYGLNLANCNNFTNGTGASTGANGIIGLFSFSAGLTLIPGTTWGNYFYFDNDQDTALSNVFSGSSGFLSAPSTCDTSLPILCVS